MARLSVNETALALAVSHSRSLRTTVPLHIVEQLGLKEKDVIMWSMDKDGEEWIATIRKKA